MNAWDPKPGVSAAGCRNFLIIFAAEVVAIAIVLKACGVL